MSDELPRCGAQAWRTFESAGVFVSRVFRTSEVTCTYDRGHDDRHGGWLHFDTATGDVQALVRW